MNAGTRLASLKLKLRFLSIYAPLSLLNLGYGLGSQALELTSFLIYVKYEGSIVIILRFP